MSIAQAFERKLFSAVPQQKRWANYRDLNDLVHAGDVRAMWARYQGGAYGDVTAARSERYREALEELSQAARDVLELFIAISARGLKGTIAEQSEIARHVERLVRKCKTRKARYGLEQLVERGWILCTPLPTGRRTELGAGRWTTRRVNQYTCTSKLRSLFRPPSRRSRTSRPDAASTPASSGSPSAPAEWQKVPPMDRRESPSPPRLDEGGDGELEQISSICQTDSAGVARDDHRGCGQSTSSSSPSADGDPELAGVEAASGREVLERLEGGEPDRRTSTVESPSGAGRFEERPRPARSSSGRRKRAPRTWAAGRRSLLEALTRELQRLDQVDRLELGELLAAVAAQTSHTYAQHLPRAADWGPLILGWLDLPRAERLDELRARVIPSLLAWYEPIRRARELREIERTARDERERRIARNRLELAESRNPTPIVAIPADELEQLERRLPLARSVVESLALGRLALEELTPDYRELLEELDRVFGSGWRDVTGIRIESD